MKKMKLAALALTLVGTLTTGNALALTTSADLTVSATVDAVCTATKVTDIAFGTIDPLNTAGTIDTASLAGATPGSVNVKCTSGTTFTFSAPAGTITDGGTGSMAYTPTYASGAQTPTIAGTDYVINAQIAEAQYKAAPAGSYSGNLTVTVTY